MKYKIHSVVVALLLGFGSFTVLTATELEMEKWLQPVQGLITNPFGHGYPFYGVYRGGHTGVDIKAAIGTPVYAAASGQVKKVNAKNNQRYGRYVIIEHSNHLFTLYGHLQSLQVGLNKSVAAGEQIGTVGVTGAAGYPHLHFEIIDQVPIRDGAWGYYYICKQPTGNKEEINFRDKRAVRLRFIKRLKQGHCLSSNLSSPIIYYNPEYFLPPYAQGVFP